MNIKLNKSEIKDKITACWIGKNIGGTMGGPYEGSREFRNITGFSTAPGNPLPNDDLDLQLVWLMMAERAGAKALNANVLAHGWKLMITPHWNEYGVGKKNLNLGLLPPLSGEYQNELWRNSNGAWIRTEIWACFAPGIPNVATKYAIMDASVDHGTGEGTYAAIFTAALESLAFTSKDIRMIIENALTYIPEDCRVALTVKRVIEEYDKKTDYEKVRNIVVSMNGDLGWFQAPGNLGFVVIGLLYGEGDFKKTMIYTINCGDDTDCTAGTVGAFLGIMYGTEGIPSEWLEYIGDRIVQMCVNPQYGNFIPQNCNELTERTMKLIPEMLDANGVTVCYTDGPTEIDIEKASKICKNYSSKYFERARFSFDVSEYYYMNARVEYEKAPEIKPFEEFDVTVKFEQIINKEPISASINVVLPEGWTADYRKSLHISRIRDLMDCSQEPDFEFPNLYSELKIKITPNENISAVNKVYVIVERDTHIEPFVIPLTLIG